MLMLYLDATHDGHDVKKDSMLEEFVASLMVSQTMRGPSLGRLSTTQVVASLTDYATSKTPRMCTSDLLVRFQLSTQQDDCHGASLTKCVAPHSPQWQQICLH